MTKTTRLWVVFGVLLVALLYFGTGYITTITRNLRAPLPSIPGGKPSGLSMKTLTAAQKSSLRALYLDYLVLQEDASRLPKTPVADQSDIHKAQLDEAAALATLPKVGSPAAKSAGQIAYRAIVTDFKQMPSGFEAAIESPYSSAPRSALSRIDQAVSYDFAQFRISLYTLTNQPL